MSWESTKSALSFDVKNDLGIPVVAKLKQIRLGTVRLSLALLSGLRIWRYCELWCRPAATAPIRLLAWEPPYAAGVALEKTKRQKLRTKTKKHQSSRAQMNPRSNTKNKNLHLVI